MIYTIGSSLTLNNDKYKKYSSFLKIVATMISLEGYIYIIDNIKQVLDENISYTTFSDGEVIFAICHQQTTELQYLNKTLGYESTQTIYEFFIELIELKKSEEYFLNKSEIGIYYPLKDKSFQYEIVPCIHVKMSSDPLDISVNYFTIELNKLTFAELDEITEGIKSVIQGKTPIYNYKLDKYHRKNDHSRYYHLIIDANRALIKEGTHYEDAEDWDGDILEETSAQEMYQLFKDFRDCWYEAERGLPIHWRKSLK